MIRSTIKKNKNDLMFLCLFTFTLMFLLYKVRYGFIYNDEPAIFSIGYRFALGDKMLVEDWSIMQLIGFLIYPFAKLFMLIKKDTNWILLYGRLCYLLLWSMTIIYSYIKLKKYGIWSVLGLISLYLFAPLDMMTLSYNSFALMGLICTTVTIISARNEYEYIFIGIFYSITVLSNPYFILLYLFFTIAVFLNIKFHFLKLPNELIPLKVWESFTFGAILMFIILTIFVFSKTNLSKLLQSLTYILKSDTEHSKLNIFKFLYSYIFQLNLRFKYTLIFSNVLFIVTLLDKSRYKRKKIYILISICIYLYSIININSSILTYPNLNLTVIPFIIIGVEAYILSESKNNIIFIYLIISGIIFSFFFHYASNLGLPAIGTTYSLSTLGSIIYVGILYKEMDKSKLTKFILVLIVIIQIIFQFMIRYKYYYLDDPIEKLNVRIEDGPAKGIYTNESDASLYNYQYEQLMYLLEESSKNDGFYYPYSNPWFYLASNMKISTYSTWGSWGDVEKTNEINKLYYMENINKTPTYIVLDKYTEPQLSEYIIELLNEGYETKESYDYMLYFLSDGGLK